MLRPGVGAAEAWLVVGQLDITGVQVVATLIGAPATVIIRFAQSLATLDHADSLPLVGLGIAGPFGHNVTHGHGRVLLLTLGSGRGNGPSGRTQRGRQRGAPFQVRFL